MVGFIKVATTEDLEDDEVMQVDFGEEQVLLTKLHGKFYAISDECTHQGGPLAQGWVEDGLIECPLHANQFDVKTGESMGPLSADPVRSYPVRIEGEDVLVGPAE